MKGPRCRYAGLEDLDAVLEALHEFHWDEPLSKSAKVDMRFSDSFDQGIASLIESKNILIACGADASGTSEELYGLIVFYEKYGLDPLDMKSDDGIPELEINAMQCSKATGWGEESAHIFSACNVCLGLNKLGPGRFLYMDVLAVRDKHRKKGVATALVRELERLLDEEQESLIMIMAVATSPGTSKILDLLGWKFYNTLNTKNFTYRGELAFDNLDLEIKAYTRPILGLYKALKKKYSTV